MIRSLLLVTALVLPSLSHAQDAQLFRRHTRSSCSTRSVDRFYCPWFGGQFNGPYFDNGCSVKCSNGQRATCQEATCEEGQTGQPVYSRCSCD